LKVKGTPKQIFADETVTDILLSHVKFDVVSEKNTSKIV
jgi:hypothetical protein